MASIQSWGSKSSKPELLVYPCSAGRFSCLRSMFQSDLGNQQFVQKDRKEAGRPLNVANSME